MRLPNIPYGSKAPEYQQVRFSGIERDKFSSDGSVYDMMNISTSEYPVLRTSDRRRDSGERYERPWYYGMADKEYVIAGENEGTAYPLWEVKTYEVGDIVAYEGYLYIAVKNVGTTTDGYESPPTERGGFWEVYTENTFAYDGEWNETKDTPKYSVWYYNGKYYRNLTGKNSEVPPDEDIDNWGIYTYASLWYGGDKIEGVELIPGDKECAYLNGYIVIIPDKMYYHTKSGVFGYLTGTKSGKFKTSDYPGFFYNGHRFNYPLEAYLTHGENITGDTDGIYNAIVFRWGTKNSGIGMSNDAKYGVFDLSTMFKADDTIAVTQKSAHTSNIAGITEGEYTVNKVGIDYVIFPTGLFSGDVINFGKNSHYVDGNKDYWYLGSMELTKGVPDMEHICTVGNRMWACKDDEVFCCSNGDCLTWKNYNAGDGGATALLAGDIGNFTACCEYNGYPMFFKEYETWMVSGYGATSYALNKVADYGVRADSPKSMCVADSILFFVSPVGICAYTGGIPAVISGTLKKRFSEATGATDGKKYYVSVNDGTERKIYVYDTQHRVWSSEGVPEDIVGIVYNDDSVWYIGSDGRKLSISGVQGDMLDPDVKAYIEFNDWYDSMTSKKSIGKVVIRAEVNPEHAPLEVYIQYDSDGYWHKVGEIYRQNSRKAVSEIGFMPHRCNHYRIRLECKGEFTLYAIARQVID